MSKKIRYAVVGLGHIAQVAVLPGFKNAKKNSKLEALVSDDPVKLKELSKLYKVRNLFSMDEYEKCLKSGLIDAVYVATPNTEHQRFAELACRYGIHVLCEKPLTVSEQASRSIGKAVERSGIKFMVAYRLHFDSANLRAIEVAKKGKLGNLRYFSSIFSMTVQPPNIRLQEDMGGGPLHDIGIYCINAARYLFQAEPTEVFAAAATTSKDARFAEVDEMVSAILRFPENRLASFTCSFGSADRAEYDLVGTKGSLRLQNAYEYASPMKLTIKTGDRVKTKKYRQRDQFGPELYYFSDCILNDRDPEPSIAEGLADVVVLEALIQSLDEKKSIKVKSVSKDQRPNRRQEIRRRAVREPPTVHVNSPTGPH